MAYRVFEDDCQMGCDPLHLWIDVVSRGGLVIIDGVVANGYNPG
jgi:hypothetical protein